MSKKAYLFTALLLGLLALVLTVTYFYLKHQEFLSQRHHLLCEDLRPGMSKDDVLNILNQIGDFKVNEVDWSNAFFALDISFKNPNILAKYGYFSVVFIDNKYARAVVPHGSDNPEYICNFYRATESIIGTP
jgi:hypothetical protein